MTLVLFKNVPLDTISGTMKELIRKMYKVNKDNNTSQCVHINVGSGKHLWSTNKYKRYEEYDLNKTLKALKQYTCTIWTIPFLQKIWIRTMGDNCAPFLEDLFLFWLKYKFMTNHNVAIFKERVSGLISNYIIYKECKCKTTYISAMHEIWLILEVMNI